MNKLIPGMPWEICRYPINGSWYKNITIGSGDPKDTRRVCDMSPLQSPETREALGALICAAPEMFMLLKELQENKDWKNYMNGRPISVKVDEILDNLKICDENSNTANEFNLTSVSCECGWKGYGAQLDWGREPEYAFWCCPACHQKFITNLRGFDGAASAPEVK